MKNFYNNAVSLEPTCKSQDYRKEWTLLYCKYKIKAYECLKKGDNDGFHRNINKSRNIETKYDKTYKYY